MISQQVKNRATSLGLTEVKHENLYSVYKYYIEGRYGFIIVYPGENITEIKNRMDYFPREYARWLKAQE